MGSQLGITWTEAGAVFISTIGIYLTFTVLVRIFGQRSLASMSTFDLGCALALGAIVGRTSLLFRPTLVAGMVAITTLFAVRGLLSVLRTRTRLHRVINRPPVLLMVGSRLVPENMRRGRVSMDEVRQQLRLAGVRDWSEVAAVILESNGAVSVIRRGMELSPELVADIAGHEVLLDASAHRRP